MKMLFPAPLTPMLTLLQSTSELKGYDFHFGGYNINLVDSLCFNDPYKSEAEVSGDIANWLNGSYERDRCCII